MGAQTVWNDEAIIADALGRSPDIQLGGEADGWRLCRWRQFVGSYTLPPLPDPIFVVHIAGKPSVKTWERDGWSESISFPGCATIVPSGMSTGWLVDGELDVRSAGIHADFAQAGERSVAHHLIFAIGERLGRRDRNRIAGVNAHRIDVLDGTHDDDVVGQIAHHL